MPHEDYHRLVQSDQVPPSVIGSDDDLQIVMATGFLANAPVTGPYSNTVIHINSTMYIPCVLQ